MTTIVDAFQAGIDAVTADNSLNKTGFSNAIRTVIDQRFTFAEAQDWVDALAVEHNRLGITNNPTYANMRSKIINNAVACAALFEALSAGIGLLPETIVAQTALQIKDLRAERDEADANIDILVALKVGQPKQVRDAINIGIDQLRGYKQNLRDQIQNLIGDPDG